MISIMYSSMMFMLITNIMMMISIFLSKKMENSKEKNSPFECGFDPQSMKRIPFSLHFFLIAIIFLIFDVEIVLILPLISTFPKLKLINWLFTSIFFFLMLLMGLYYEWYSNILNWTK
uniref:NADH-ubiquinone oxidoreductase chain 3 n=1 Tax=Rhyacophila kando TaxID=2904902 RepID=A0A9E8RU14_9NEOP|nr:NADH dehydrogenase subunit 3 [Rhyacophila kando]UZZ44357.1 NADH dehydrogenase subunit 3 [Rhyacophila kando]